MRNTRSRRQQILQLLIEHGSVQVADLVERFGVATAELVDGLTKLDKLQFSTREESQAESFPRCCWRWRATCA